MTENATESLPLNLSEDQLAQLADAIAAVLAGYLVRRDPAQVRVDDPINKIGDRSSADNTMAVAGSETPTGDPGREQTGPTAGKIVSTTSTFGFVSGTPSKKESR